MEKLTCKKCNGDLRFYDNSLVCSQCGETYSMNFDSCQVSKKAIEKTFEMPSGTILENPVENLVENPAEMPAGKPNGKSSKRRLFILLGIGIALTAFALFGWLYIRNLPSNQIKSVLEENNYYGAEFVDSASLGDNIDGLDGENSLVLLKKKSGGVTMYSMAAVNLETRTVTDLYFGYSPLNIVIMEIFSDSERTNVRNMEEAEEYIRDYGFHCFEDQKYAEMYLRDITGEDGIIDTQTARRSIIDSISDILPDVSSASDYYVVFESGNANPTHYATSVMENRYNWNHIFSESVYKTWKASTDAKTQEIMISLYGQPYVMAEVWTVVDKNLNYVGKFNSLAAVKEIFEKGTSYQEDSESEYDLKPEETEDDVYLFPSDRMYITEADLAGKTKEEVALIRNEIYARHGYIFQKEPYKSYFKSKEWYVPNENFNESMLSSIEVENKDFLVEYEESRGWR